MNNMKLSAAQKRVLQPNPNHPYQCVLIGYDEKNRPVVEQKDRYNAKPHRWALSRTGEPLDVVGKVKPQAKQERDKP